MAVNAPEHRLETHSSGHSRLRGRVRHQAPAKTLSIFVQGVIPKTKMKTFGPMWG